MKKIILSLLLLIALAVGAVFTVWTFPQLVLTHDRVQSLLKSTIGDLFTTLPSNLDLKLTSYGFNGKHILIDADRFCMKIPEGCFTKTHVELSFKWVGLTRFRIEELGPIEILNESLTIRSSPDPKKEDEKKTSDSKWTDYVIIPPTLKLASIKIVSPKIEIASQDSSIVGDLDLSGEDIKDIWFEANAKSSDGLKAHVEAQTGFLAGNKSPFYLQLTVNDGWAVEGNLDGEIQWDNFFINLTGNLKATQLVPWIKTLELQNLKISRDQNLHLDTQVFVKLEPKLAFSERDSAMPKASYATEIKGVFDVEEKRSKDESSYDYSLKLGPNAEKGLSINALLKGSYPFPKGEEYRFGLKDLFAQVKIEQFQNLVASFRKTNSAIPAPFSSLKGSVILQAGKENAPISGDQIPLLFKTDLTGSEQVIQTNSEGNLLFKKGLKNLALEGKTVISNITLTLPEVDPIVPQPSLKRDSRIKSLVEIEKKEKAVKVAARKAQKKEESGSSFDLNWTVDSNPNSIRVFYSIARPNVPIDVHLAIKSQGMTGKISVSPLDLHYLSRDAHVDHFTYDLSKGVTSVYEGKLVIEKTDYTIFIEVFEKEGKPKIQFASDPPLDESDIISVLLFNQTSSELSPDESNSVSNTQSAVANRALGLFSVWALSSTPIEAVSYNAASGVYAARVKLAAGLTATVGTDWENTQEVALRKRIGKNFVLSTIFGQEGENADRSTKTLLEWFRRF